MIFILVFPNEANINQRNASILAPVGAAILGYRVGDTIIWQAPGGQRRIKIQEILYQREASYDHHL